MTTSMTTDICEIITRDIQKPRYELLDWVDINKLDFDNLSGNANAIELLKENPDKINWDLLSANPAAIELLEENHYNGKDNINWMVLSTNTAAI